MPTAKDDHTGIGDKGGRILPARDQPAREPGGKPDSAANLPPDLRTAAKKTLELSLREAVALGNNFIGSEHILLGLIREGDNPATQIMNRLDVEPNRVRQEVIRRVDARRVVEEPSVRRAAPRGPNRKLLPELYGRLDSLEWRMSVLEQRVGIGPDIRDLDREITQVRRDKGSRHRRPGLRGRRRAARQGKPAAHRQGRPGTGVGSPPVSERGDRAAS